MNLTITNSNAIPIGRIVELITQGLKAGAVVLTFGREKRSRPQNDHLHPVMRTIAKHMMDNGAPKWSETKWRHYFVGKFKGQEIYPDPLGGGYVVMNTSDGTSKLNKAEASEMLEWLYAFGADIGIDWQNTLSMEVQR